MNFQKIQKPRFLTDEEEWKDILKDIHSENIPIQIHRKNHGLAQLYANHVTSELYVKHSYTTLTKSFQVYMEAFETICQKIVESDTKKQRLLQEHSKVIKIVYFMNALLYRITTNFLNFVKSVKQIHFSSFERKTQEKDCLTNLCPDCEVLREEGHLKDLKRKLNLNKTQIFPIKYPYNEDRSGEILMSNDRKKQAQIINDFTRVKYQAAQNLRHEEERQTALFEHHNKISRSSLKSKSKNLANGILINENQDHIKSLSNLLQNRDGSEIKSTNIYSYLINELMNLPYINRLHEEEYVKQAEKIVERIQSELSANFILNLNDSLKPVMQKVFTKKYFKDDHQKCFKKSSDLQKINVEVQTDSSDFETKFKTLESQMQKKNFELDRLKKNKVELEKRYFEKFKEQKENQKQLHQNFIYINQLKQELKQIKDDKEIQKQKLEKQILIQVETLRNLETEHHRTLNEIKLENQIKYNQYLQRMNLEAQNNMKRQNEQKENQIYDRVCKSEIQLKGLTSPNQPFDTSRSKQKNTEKQFKKITVSERNNYNKFESILEASKKKKKGVCKTKKRAEHTQIFSFQSHQFQKDTLSPSIDDSKELADSKADRSLNDSKQSFKSIDFMIKFNQNIAQQTEKSLNSARKTQKNLFKGMDYNHEQREDHRLQRKTAKQTLIQKDDFEDFQAEKSCLNKHFSMRKFRKMQKGVQFSFKKKNHYTDQSSLFNQNEQTMKLDTEFQTEKQKNEDQDKHFDQENYESKLNQYPQMKKTITQQKFKIQDKKPAIKSVVKFKNITLEKEKESFHENLKESRNNQIHRKSFKPSYKSQDGSKKYLTNTNESWLKNSQLKFESSRSHLSFSKVKLQEEDKKQPDAWKPELESKEYDLDQVKLILEKQMQYFKLTGILQKVYAFEENEQKQIKERMLTVAKLIVARCSQKTKKVKSKDPFLKSHQTLKSILSKSMNKIYKQNSSDHNQIVRKQIETLSQNLIDQINDIETFSVPRIQDLELFGGVENAKKIDISNLNEQGLSLMVQNTINHSFSSNILKYFRKLFDLDREKYIIYTSFLKYPTSYLNGNLSKLSEKQKKYTTKEEPTVQKDVSYLKLTINKIIAYHEKQHHQKCIHLQKFLKKIGYFKYQVKSADRFFY